jgi:6-phosphofructokinase
MKVAGLLTNGGDTCSLNALLRYSRDALRDEGFTKIYGFEGGYRGLITGSYRDITNAAIDPYSGGTFLLSLRDSPTPSAVDIAHMELESKSENDRKKEKTRWSTKLKGALNTLDELYIDVLVVLGGNGTIAATVDFAKHVPSKHQLICLPRTIDNDVNTYTVHQFEGREIHTTLCPGYPSAAAKIVAAARSLRTTAASTKRIFTLETMGRDAGWLALASALGWAEVVTIPEVNLVDNKALNATNKEELIQQGIKLPQAEINVEQLCEIVTEWYEKGENRNLIISVSEGTMLNCQRITLTQYGDRKLGGAGDVVNDIVTKYIKTSGVLTRKVYPNVENPDPSSEIIEMPEARCQHTDYDPRMGEPSSYDVALAKVLAYQRLRLMLREGDFGKMPVLSKVLTEREIIEEGVKATKTVDIKAVDQILLPVQSYYDTDRLISTKAFDDFLYRIVGEGLVQK